MVLADPELTFNTLFIFMCTAVLPACVCMRVSGPLKLESQTVVNIYVNIRN